MNPTLLEALQDTTPEELAKVLLEMDMPGYAYDVAASLMQNNPGKVLPGPDPDKATTLRHTMSGTSSPAGHGTTGWP